MIEVNGLSKKKRKSKKKEKMLLKNELVGLLFIFLAIFGSGASMISDGLIPATLENVFRFIFGIWYFIASIVLISIGLMLMIKRRYPIFFTKRKVGLLIFVLGLLLFSHIQTFQSMFIDVRETSVLKATWQHYIAYINGQGVASQLGGGFIGAILLAIIQFLFSFVGAKIIAVFSMLVGLLFFINLSIGQMTGYLRGKLSSFMQSLQKKRKTNKEKKEARLADKQIEEVVDDEDTIPLQNEEVPAIPYDIEETTTGQLEVQMMEEQEMAEETVEIENMPLHERSYKETTDYTLPSIELLNLPQKHSQKHEKSQINQTVKLLEETFQSFGVKAKITKAHVGPAVTKYEVYPDAGVKVSRIVNLQDDLALALAAQDIRIEAPIPGKSAVGIEVPNGSVAPVSLREVLDIGNVQDKKLQFALGKDISGSVVQGELNKMPHLLIAGATGSGKSVCINGIITSILMRATPDEVKMMMIDPKKVELNVYNGIPHLLTPVVTDPKKASMALKKIVAEMEYRYELFSETGTRNLESYNNHLMRENKGKSVEDKRPSLPYIVVLVDELADLMMVASKDVEDAITRLAQMARAAGIHLIIATQRPSVDVITGVIKANIPSRIAFSVSSQVDSRTILDMGGAEKLLGRGDMLYIPVGMSKPIRVQGAFLSDDEVERIVTHCKNEQTVEYKEEMKPEAVEESFDEVEDEHFEDAVQLVIEMQSASVSMLQRRFRIGYTRAARLIDMMEARQIVGPYEGNKPRIVLIEKEEEKSS